VGLPPHVTPTCGAWPQVGPSIWSLAPTLTRQEREMRAAMSLSLLWRQQDKCDPARQLLAPIYSGFTAGFDTAHLQESKALVRALG
jgi:predicted ATPase